MRQRRGFAVATEPSNAPLVSCFGQQMGVAKRRKWRRRWSQSKVTDEVSLADQLEEIK